MTLSEKSLNTKQQTAISRLYSEDYTLLVAPTGAGKTVICLTAIKELIDAGVLNRVIVAAPAKVVENMVWTKERLKWDHLSGMRVLNITGDAKKRGSLLAYANTNDYDAIVISLNNLDWLLEQGHGKGHGCDGIIIDELSKAAGKQTAGMRSKKKADCFKWRVGMTATPVSQNFEKLYSMCRILSPKYLGTNKQKYLDQYFYSDYQGYNWTLRDGADELIAAKIAPLVHLVEDTKATDLPPCCEHVITFDMPAETRVVYNDMKKHMIAGDVEAANEAVKSGKLRQIASGFMYDDMGVGDHIDFARSDEAAKWMRKLKKQGRKGIIFYEFTHSRAELDYCTAHQYGIDVATEIDVGDFTRAKDHVILLAQINSLSHGVDGLQDVCSDILFYHPMWSRDATEQAIGRVWRTGQTKEVNVTTLVCDDTLDELVMDRVEDRGEWMKLFKQHLKG